MAMTADRIHFQDTNGKFRIFDTRHEWCRGAKFQIKLTEHRHSITVIYTDHVRTYANCTIIKYFDGVQTIQGRKEEDG